MTASLTTQQTLVLQELVDSLNEHGIDFVVIGGLAAIAWGVKRPLADIDIQVSIKDFQKVENLFAADTTTKTRHYETEKWDIYQMIIQLSGVYIDICRGEDFYVKKEGKKYLIPNSIGKAPIQEVGAISIPVLPRRELIKYKQLIARPVDIEDVSALLLLQ